MTERCDMTQVQKIAKKPGCYSDERRAKQQEAAVVT